MARLLDQFGQPLAPSTPRRRSWPAVAARYDSAQTSRHNQKHWAQADHLGPNASNSRGVRQTIRSRARYEAFESNSYARGIVSTLCNDTIGAGPALQMTGGNAGRNRQLERDWRKWARAIQLAPKLRLMRGSKCVDGETFASLFSNPTLPDRINLPVQLDLAPFECDLVQDPFLTQQTDPHNADGVFHDEFGNPVCYRVLKQHPGDPWGAFGQTGAGIVYDDVPARWVLHLFRRDRPGQRRGISEINPALPLFAQLRAFTLAVLSAAEFAAAQTASVETTATNLEPDSSDDDDFQAIEFERGMLNIMPAGYRMSQMRAEQPTTTYEMFKNQILNEIARCLDMPFNVAACNSADYNYASGRLDYQIYQRALRVERDLWELACLDRILEEFLREYLGALAGISPDDVDLTDYPHQWNWDEGEHVDPVKEATAEQIDLENGSTNLARIYARRGEDWEPPLRQRAAELALMRELHIPIANDPLAPPPRTTQALPGTTPPSMAYRQQLTIAMAAE